MKHDIPVERLLELMLLREIQEEQWKCIEYYNFKGLKYNSPYDLDKINIRVSEIQDEFLDEYKVENYANLTDSKE